MSNILTDIPVKKTWAGLGRPQRFQFQGTGANPVSLSGHFIGRVDEAGGRLYLYDLNGIQRAHLHVRTKFWALASPY